MGSWWTLVAWRLMAVAALVRGVHWEAHPLQITQRMGHFPIRNF